MDKYQAKLKERILQDLEILNEELNYADGDVRAAINCLVVGSDFQYYYIWEDGVVGGEQHYKWCKNDDECEQYIADYLNSEKSYDFGVKI